MKPSIFLIAALCLGFSTTTAQTLKPNDKTIDECFKRSSKTPKAFDLCVQQEFERLREEARPKSESEKESIALMKSGKNKDLLKLFYLTLEQMNESNAGLYATPNSDWRWVVDYPRYYPRHYHRTYYYPYFSRYHPRYFPRYFPRSIYRY